MLFVGGPSIRVTAPEIWFCRSVRETRAIGGRAAAVTDGLVQSRIPKEIRRGNIHSCPWSVAWLLGF